jgi:hypothetical protein
MSGKGDKRRPEVDGSYSQEYDEITWGTIGKGNAGKPCGCVGGCLEADDHLQYNRQRLPNGVFCQIKGNLSDQSYGDESGNKKCGDGLDSVQCGTRGKGNDKDDHACSGSNTCCGKCRKPTGDDKRD